jgi:hypothetical protein
MANVVAGADLASRQVYVYPDIVGPTAVVKCKGLHTRCLLLQRVSYRDEIGAKTPAKLLWFLRRLIFVFINILVFGYLY